MKDPNRRNVGKAKIAMLKRIKSTRIWRLKIVASEGNLRLSFLMIPALMCRESFLINFVDFGSVLFQIGLVLRKSGLRNW